MAATDGDADSLLLGPIAVRGYRTVIGGPTGEGKTTISFQILRAIVAGEAFLEWQGRGKCRALIVDLEQGARTLRRRLCEAKLNRAGVDIVSIPGGLSLDSDRAQLEEFDRLLSRGYDIVLVDPLYKMHTGDSSDERAAVDLMRVLDAWREQLGFALLLVAHCRKRSSDRRFRLALDDIFGSSAYVRGAEVVLGIQRTGDGRSRLLYLKDRDGDLPINQSWKLLFTAGVGFEREPDDGDRRARTADTIRAQLEEHPWELTKPKLQEITGIGKRTLEQALSDLGAEHRPGGGAHSLHVYALAGSGSVPSARRNAA